MSRLTIISSVLADSDQKMEWIGEMVESILAQDYDDWELIIVDDFSPRRVDELMPKYPDERIRWLRGSKPQGPSTCRNSAVALAKSPSIMVLDGDDLLASNTVLSQSMPVWEANQSSVIYGDLQWYEWRPGANRFDRTKVVKFPRYDFELSLDKRGLIPVTAIHSVDAHLAAGGWKPDFVHGLEDVEYWIAMGKAGYCGLKIDMTMFLYRRHTASRTGRMRALGHEGRSLDLIEELHKDVYEGRYPMGCCGGGSSASNPSGTVSPQSVVGQGRAQTELMDIDNAVWIRYEGKRTGAFGVIGPSTKTNYQIEGQGHVFAVDKTDVNIFRRSGRGRDFALGVRPPVGAQKATSAPAERYSPPAPEMAELERLESGPMPEVPEPPEPPIDNVPEPVVTRYERVIVPKPEPVSEPDPLAAPKPEELKDLRPLTILNLPSDMQDMLEIEGWNVQGLASADPQELLMYPGIGGVWAGRIVERAKEALGDGDS